MTTATKYIARQTAQRLILVACGDLDKLVATAREYSDPNIVMSPDDAEKMSSVLKKARESLIGV